MAGYSTTIRSDVEVSGIGELEQASAALKEVAESARRLNGSNFSNMGGGFANVEAGAKKAAEANKLLANSAKTAAEAQKNASAAGTYTKQIGEINKLTEAYAKMESAAKKAEAAEKTRFSATQSNYQREREQSGTQNFSTPNYSETGKKLGSSFKEAVGMFSLGMLGANAVMGVFDGVKNMVSGGWETLNDRQRGQAMWATSISDAHGTSGSALTSQSSKANDQIMMTALKAGNNFDEANSFAKQIYSSDAGVYSGSLGKTNHMLKGIFNIQDANALNDREMEQFKTAVGNVGDTGKMSGTIAKSFNLLDGKITRSIRKEYEKETGHELGKNKQGGWDWASVSAEMAYRGIDNYGNSGGIAKASERYNSTLPGVIRSVKEGSKDYISQVMKTFGDEVAKGGGFSDVLGKISKAFTSRSLITNADQFASKLSGLANALGTGIKEIAPYAKTFGSGFMSGVKGTFNIIKMGVDQLKSFGSAIGKMIPEGSQKHIMDAVQAVGKFAGVAATVAASMKVLKGGASLLGDAGKGIKGILTGITRSKTTGDSVFSRATSQFSAAVSRFAGASGVKNAAGMAGDSLPGGFSKDAKGKYHRANGQYASDAEIAQLETRTGRRALASEAEASAGVFGRLFSKGQELKGVAGIAGETGRLAKNAGLLSRMGGSLATTVGKAGMAVSASKLGTVVSGIGKAGKFLGKGMPLLNGLFAGIDVMSTMATTQKGSLARHKGVGSAVGNGVGATIGGALGSALGPFGTVAGAMAGGWLGGKAGSWIGGMFGGTKDDKPKQTVAQRNAEAVNKAQTAAQATMAKQDFASNMAAYGYDKKNANELYSQINKGTNSKSKAKQIAAARMQEAIDAGDAAAISKWQSKLNKQNGILPGQENVDNRPKRIKARQVSLSDDKGAKKAEANAKAVSKANKSVKAPKGTDWNKYALNAQKASQKADKEFKKSAKSIGKTKIAPKSDKKGFDKVNRDAKSGMNKATKTVKSGAKKTQKAGKDAFKFKTSKSGFNKLNRDAKSGMNKVNRTVKSGSKKVQRSGKNMFKFKSSKSGFNKLNSQAKSGINKVARTVKSGVKKVQNAGKNVFKFKSSKSGFNQLNSTARSGMSRVARTVKSGATKIQNAAKNAFKFKAASSGFNQLNSQAKSGISRVTSTIKSGSSKWDSAIQSSLSKAASTMSSQFSKMASTASSKSSAIASSMAKIGTAASAAASKVNALQSAIDRLKSKTITITANVTGKGASKLATGTPGAKSAFASLIPRYAKGTTQGGHGGGLALVNDAKGANWREAFMLPNGLVGLFPNKRDLMMPLPTGTQVLNGDDTKKMFPRYASGTNGAKKAFGGGLMGNINITVNISGNASASDANAIGNTIGEKLMTILNPETI